MQNKIDNIINRAFEEFEQALIKLKLKKMADGTFEIPKNSAGQLIKTKKNNEFYACVLTITPPKDEADTTHTMAMVLQTLQQGKVAIPDNCIKIIDRAEYAANPKYDVVRSSNPKHTVRLPLGDAIENTIVIWGPAAFQLLNQHILVLPKYEIQIPIAHDDVVVVAQPPKKSLATKETTADNSIAHALSEDAELKELEAELAKEAEKAAKLAAEAAKAEQQRQQQQQEIEKAKAARKQALEAQLREVRQRNADLEREAAKKQERSEPKDPNTRDNKRSAFSKGNK